MGKLRKYASLGLIRLRTSSESTFPRGEGLYGTQTLPSPLGKVAERKRGRMRSPLASLVKMRYNRQDKFNSEFLIPNSELFSGGKP